MNKGANTNAGILVLNAGSSSLKFALIPEHEESPRLLAGSFSRIGLPDAQMTMLVAGQQEQQRTLPLPDHSACLTPLQDFLKAEGAIVNAIGHRVVQGGPHFYEPERVTPDMLTELRKLVTLDPDHLPAALGLIDATGKIYPDVPQVACFDTAFHRGMPRVAKLLPLPRRYEAMGVHRYGFHGLSYAYLMQELEKTAGAKASKGRVILAHLGNGASMTAVRDGQSLDTTMGFTPTSGLMMSTRSGDLDPGLVMYLAQTEKMTAGQFNEMVNKRSGLLGVSEISSDVRDLQKSSDIRAAEALALFCYQAKKWIGALAAVLGGVDTLVFAGGIGENSPVLRSRICEGLVFLGIELDEARNQAAEPILSQTGSKATVRLIRTDEELMIARYVRELLQGKN